MNNWLELAAEIDSAEQLYYLRQLVTTKGWGLQIVVQECLPIRWPENPERDFEPLLASRIRAEMDAKKSPEPRAFEISFREAVCYLVQNESYGKYPEPPEIFTGRYFRIFSQSRLLDLTRDTTYTSEDHPGPEPLQHFSIVCQDDVIDVIACSKPRIRRIAPEDI